MSHVYGFGPDNPEDELVRCYSSFMGMGKMLNERYGKEKAGKLGYKLGLRIGQITKMLNVLYKNSHISTDILQQKALIHFGVLLQLPKAEIVLAIEKNAKSCRWFDIPLLPMINGLEIGAGKE